MPSEKLTRILLAKSPYTPDQICRMTESEGWNWVYSNSHKKERLPEICFSGFSAIDRDVLEKKAKNSGRFEVVHSVTEKLEFLCVGENVGPAKLAKAKKKNVCLIDANQFEILILTGEVPTNLRSNI